MKQILNVVTLAFLLIINCSCHAQKMVQKTSDAKKLEINEKEFIGKPLKILLKAIKPKIETAIARSDNPSQPSFFNFYFTPKEEYDKYRIEDKFPLTIKVYIKGTFEWDRSNRTKDNWLNWTKEDEEKYGNLIVVGIKVYNYN